MIIGYVGGWAAANHPQGDNPDHDDGDCGVVCCAEVLSQFGVRLTEAEAVRHATRMRELHVVPGHPEQSGWTLPADQAAILGDYGVPAHEEDVQRGHGAIAAVNAGVLWCDRGLLRRRQRHWRTGGFCVLTEEPRPGLPGISEQAQGT